jgi:antitoxin component YwqK of YwqJK toxin-antitoxin module
MKTLTFALLMIGLLSPAQADDSIQLPSGTTVKISSFAASPKWKECFPADHAFFAEKYGEGSLKGMHSRYSGRLDGASAILHENGNLKMLMYVPGGQRQGACRVWDENRQMVLYAKYKDDKKHGVTCLFKDGAPWFVQEWDQGTLQSETLVAKKGSDYVAVEDEKQLADAQKKLSAVDKERAADEADAKKSLTKWFSDEKSRYEKEKGKVLGKVARAHHTANQQAIRQEKDARVDAAHTHHWGKDRVGRVAHADKNMATRDLNAAKKNSKAITNEAKHELSEMDTEIAEHCKELYQFALAALDKSLPDNASQVKPSAH